MMNDRRWPAEWETHEATWLSWPHDRSLSWPGPGVHAIRPTMLLLAESLAEVEKVYINISSEDDRAYIEKFLGKETRRSVFLFDIPTNDPWCRDHGPVIVLDRGGSREGICWRFNAWGQKYEPWTEDALAGGLMVNAMGWRTIRSKLVLEPGGIEGNGAGLALVSQRSVVDEMRNPGLDRESIEVELKRQLALERLVWVDLEIEGDDTDGHVDNFARFVAEDVIAVTSDGLDANPHLRDLGCEIVVLPVPSGKVIVSTKTCPASYANFYIANKRVIVPQFGDAADGQALGIIRDCFPDRTAVPLDSRELLWGHGGFHCITQQVPAAGTGAS